jgi:hypothetical protein
MDTALEALGTTTDIDVERIEGKRDGGVELGGLYDVVTRPTDRTKDGQWGNPTPLDANVQEN